MISNQRGMSGKENNLLYEYHRTISDHEEQKSSFYPKLNLLWKEKRNTILFKRYHQEISEKKEEIDKSEVHGIWDKMKKIGNPYELIFTTYHRKRKNESISNYIPLSRSYFKMWEMFYNYPLINTSQFPVDRTHFRCAHLAEGPGGFMEATYNYLQQIRGNM